DRSQQRSEYHYRAGPRHERLLAARQRSARCHPSLSRRSRCASPDAKGSAPGCHCREPRQIWTNADRTQLPWSLLLLGKRGLWHFYWVAGLGRIVEDRANVTSDLAMCSLDLAVILARLRELSWGPQRGAYSPAAPFFVIHQLSSSSTKWTDRVQHHL